MTTFTETIRVLLVEDDPDFSALVERWLAVDIAERKIVLIWLDTLRTATTRFLEGDIDVVLLDLNLSDSRGLETFEALASLNRDVPIIVLSSSESDALAVETVRRGAETYLVKGACTTDSLARALSYAVARRERIVGMARQPRVIGLVGVKGGTGCTTVACTLARELHRHTKGSVLLADFDFDRGLVGFMMQVNPRYSLKHVFRNLDRLDDAVWTGLVADVDGMHVLPSGTVDGAEHADPSAIAKVLGIAVRVYDYVVVDFGHAEAYLKLKDRVTDLLLITTDGIPSLYLTKQSLSVIKERGVEDKRVAIVINHAHPTPATTPADFSMVFGEAPYADLPYDEHALHQAQIENRLPTDTSAFGVAVSNLARRLAGLDPVKAKRTGTGLFSLFNKSKAGPPAETKTKVGTT
jgi:Flp pilus assembly CpaE family ATPase